MPSSPIGAWFPSTLGSVGLKSPEYVYKGDSIVNPDEIFVHCELAPTTTSAKFKIYRNGSAMQKSSADAEIEVTATNKDGSVTGLDNVTIADGDVFKLYCSQVDGGGTGGKVHWGVNP